MKQIIDLQLILRVACVILLCTLLVEGDDRLQMPAHNPHTGVILPLDRYLNGTAQTVPEELESAGPTLPGSPPTIMTPNGPTKPPAVPVSPEAVATEKQRQFEQLRKRLLYLVVERPAMRESASQAEWTGPPPRRAEIEAALSDPSSEEDLIQKKSSGSTDKILPGDAGAVVERSGPSQRQVPPLRQSDKVDAEAPNIRLPPPVSPPDPMETVPDTSLEEDGLPEDVNGVPPEPIDRMGLADSLFAKGEVLLALEAYRAIPEETLAGGDKLWVSYQLACCHRRLGELDAATEAYRKIVEIDAGGWIGASARWWMETLTTRQAILQMHDQLAKQIQELESQDVQPAP